MEGIMEDELKSKNPHHIVRIALVVVFLTLGVFTVWAALFPLSEGAPAPGTVTVANYRKVVQHPYGGTVKEILVREGDEVKRDQVLIRLEDSDLKAQFSQVQAEYLSALVVYSRLQSERGFHPEIVLHPELTPFLNHPEVKKVLSVQRELFLARRAKFEADKAILNESISGLKRYIRALGDKATHLRGQLIHIQTQISSLSDITEEGYYPRNRLIDLQRVAEAVETQISETQADIARAEAQIKEYQMRIISVEKEYLKEIKQEMTDVEKRLLALRDMYNATKDKLEKTEIRSPEEGIVMGLRVHTIGGVIRPADPILEIVPKNAELIIEAKVSTAHIEDVKVDQPVDLRFPALDPKKTPVFTGSVTYLSPDALVEQVQGHNVPYYLIRVKLDQRSHEEIKRLNKEILPGMPVQVIVKTGERTFFNFLFKPFVDRLATAFLK